MKVEKSMQTTAYFILSLASLAHLAASLGRIRQNRRDARCMDARVEAEFAKFCAEARREAAAKCPVQLTTPLQRVLAHVPQVTGDQVNDHELVRLTTMQGFHD